MLIDSDVKQVGIIGLGAWGTALGVHLCRSGFEVVGYVRDNQKLVSASRDFQNYGERVLNLFKLTDSIVDCFKPPVLLICIPSRYFIATISNYIDQIKRSGASEYSGIVVSCVKGMVGRSETPFDYLERMFPSAKMVVFSGPSFASDVLTDKPVCIVSAAKEEFVAQKIANVFSRSKMRVYTSTDIIGVEWGGILKNIIAIIVGIAKGCLWGDSVQSAIITRGLTEMVRFGVSCGANADTLYGLSGLGDLVMTSTSELSRNHNFGYKVGTLGIFEAKRSSNDTIEGLNSLPFVLQLAKERGIDMPLSFTLAEVLAGEITPLQGLEELLSRPLKNE